MAWFKRNPHPEDQLSAYVDGELSPAARRSVQAHLAGCETCSALLGELQATKSLLAALPQLQPRRSFALGPEYAVERRPEPRRSSFAFAPVAALTVFLALVAVDVASFGSSGSSNDGAGALSTANTRQSEADRPESADTFQAAGSDAAGTPSPGAGASNDASTPMTAMADADAGEEDREAISAPQPAPPDETPVIAPAADRASSDGMSLLRILEACAAVAFAASLLIVLWPRIRQRGE